MYKHEARRTSEFALCWSIAFLLRMVVFADKCEEEDALCGHDEVILLQVDMDLPRTTLARTSGTLADGGVIDVDSSEQAAVTRNISDNTVTGGNANEELVGEFKIQGHMTNKSAVRTATGEAEAKNSGTQSSNRSTPASTTSMPVSTVKDAIKQVKASVLRWGHVYIQAWSRMPSREKAALEVVSMAMERICLLLIPLGLSLISGIFILFCVRALDEAGRVLKVEPPV